MSGHFVWKCSKSDPHEHTSQKLAQNVYTYITYRHRYPTCRLLVLPRPLSTPSPTRPPNKGNGMICAMNVDAQNVSTPTGSSGMQKTARKQTQKVKLPLPVPRPAQLQAHAKRYGISLPCESYVYIDEMPIQMDPSHTGFSAPLRPHSICFPNLAHLARPCRRTHLALHPYTRPPPRALSPW